MKAVILKAHGSADNFADADLPLPDLRPADVRIRVKAVSFNPVDYQIRKGLPEGRHVTSNILGRDLSGIVDAVARNVGDFRAGEAVFSYVCNLASSGTYAEYVSVPAELVARKPTSLSYEQAAAVPVAGLTAMIALTRARAAAGKSLFIAGGAGGVGTFAIMLARQLGIHKLVTTAGNPRSRHYLMEKCGLRPDQIVDYKDEDFVTQAMKRNGGPFDIALDLVGGRMLSACGELLAIDGDLASITEAPSQAEFETLFQKNASFHSIGANAYSLRDDRASWRKYRDMLDRLAQFFDSGAIAPPPITVLGSMSAEVVREAHGLLERSAVQGKLVMTC
jgi:NADPH2:quinone reductase